MPNETTSDGRRKKPGLDGNTANGLKESGDPTTGMLVERREPWFERLTKAKLSPLIVLAFIALLAVFAAAATGISYGVHRLAQH